MKEATGELNMTVITVVAIAAVGALFTFFVWPSIQANLMLNTACSQVNSNGNFTSPNDAQGKITCTSFKCKAEYNGHTYEKECNQS